MAGFICCIAQTIQAAVVDLVNCVDVDLVQLITDLVNCFLDNCQLLQGLG